MNSNNDMTPNLSKSIKIKQLNTIRLNRLSS